MESMLALVLCAGPGAVMGSAQTRLDVKTGEWETTTVSQGLGGAMAALPPGLLDKMPPEQRAKFEERMKAAGAPRTTVTKRCLTKEDLAKAFDVPSSQRQQCTSSVVSSTSSRQQVKIACEMDKAKSSGTMTVEALDSTHIKGDMQMSVQAGAAAANNISFNFSSKWLGAVCGEAKKN